VLSDSSRKAKGKRKHLAHGEWIRREKRIAIYIRDEWKCLYCGKALEGLADGQEVTLDHLAEDGGNHESNLVTACKACNTAKAGYSVESFASKDARERIARAITKPLDIRAGRAYLHETREKKDAFDLPTIFAPPAVAAHYMQTTDKALFQFSQEGIIDPPSEKGYDFFKTIIALYVHAKSHTLGATETLKLKKLRNEVAHSELILMKSADEVIPIEWVKLVLAHQAICFRRIIESLPIDESARISVAKQVTAIDCEDFLSGLRSQIINAVSDDPGLAVSNGTGEGEESAEDNALEMG